MTPQMIARRKGRESYSSECPCPQCGARLEGMPECDEWVVDTQISSSGDHRIQSKTPVDLWQCQSCGYAGMKGRVA